MNLALKRQIYAKFRFEKKCTSDWDMYLPLGLGMDILEEVFLDFLTKKMQLTVIILSPRVFEVGRSNFERILIGF